MNRDEWIEQTATQFPDTHGMTDEGIRSVLRDAMAFADATNTPAHPDVSGLLNEALITMRNYYAHAISRATVEEFITKANAALATDDERRGKL